MINLHHRDFGGSGHFPLVFLHGLLGSSRNWQTVGRDLAARAHALALDLRNHGSSPSAETHTYQEMVEDVLRWMDAQQLSRVDLLGHSMGGKVGMLLACRHPDRVRGLVVADIAPRRYGPGSHAPEFAAMASLPVAEIASRAAADADLARSISDWGLRQFLLTNLVRTDEKFRWGVHLPVLRDALAEIESNPLAPSDRFDGPVLFLAGTRSDYVQASDEEVVRRHFPRAEICRVEAGHNPHIEARAEFSEAVGEFLSRLAPAGSSRGAQ